MKKDVKDRVYQIVRRVTEDAAIGKTDTNNKYAVCVKKYMKRIPHGDASSYNNVLVKENFD
jgi:hypothetical protein